MLKSSNKFPQFLSFISRNMSSSSKNSVGLCQMRSTNDKNHNKQQITELFSRAKGQASLLMFPECCDYIGSNATETQKLAESLTGDTVKFYQKLCAESNIWVSNRGRNLEDFKLSYCFVQGSFGGIHELATDSAGNKPGKLFNSHIIIDSNGEIVGLYRKMHLFDVETPEKKFEESKYVKPGIGAVYPVQTPVGIVGLTICYDIRFPEVLHVQIFDSIISTFHYFSQQFG